MARQAVKLAPDSAHANYALGHYLNAERNWAGAQQCLLKAVEICPEEPLYHVALGKNYLHRLARKKAEEHLDKALELDPENLDVLKTYADFYFTNRNFSDPGYFFSKNNLKTSRMYAEKILAIRPDDAQALIITGHMLLKEGKVQDAIDHARMAIGQDPHNFNALVLIAFIKVRKKFFLGRFLRAGLWMQSAMNRSIIILLFGAPFLVLDKIGYLEKLSDSVQITLLCIFVVGFSFTFFAFAFLFKRYVLKSYVADQKLRKEF